MLIIALPAGSCYNIFKKLIWIDLPRHSICYLLDSSGQLELVKIKTCQLKSYTEIQIFPKICSFSVGSDLRSSPNPFRREEGKVGTQQNLLKEDEYVDVLKEALTGSEKLVDHRI